MMLRRTLVVLTLAILLFGCSGTSTFLITKSPSNRSYYLHKYSEGLHNQLCKSGDFERVLMGTSLEEYIKKDLLEYVCTDKHSSDEVLSLFTSFSPDEMRELKRAFVRNGYTVNYIPC